MKSSEQIRALAKKTPDEILAEADEMAKIEEEFEVQVEENRATPLSIEQESTYFAWSIERWIDNGADLKTVISIVATGFAKAFASKGYVIKLKIEKLF